MEEKDLSGTESLRIIRQMIGAARDEHHEKGDGWLIWGWLLFIASVSSVVLSYLALPGYIGYVWNSALIIGPVIFIVIYFRREKDHSVRTYVQDLLHKIQVGFYISLIVIIVSGFFAADGGLVFGYYYMLYAFWMYIHGSALRFKPLIIGAYINWTAAILMFAIDPFRYDMMISAVAVLFGYLVPGYMLKAAYRKRLLVK
jgi:Flp pilus assembly protein TadB